MHSLSSRERLLLTINHSEPDRVPFMLSLFEFPQEILPAHLRHQDQVERVERFLAAGLDDTLSIGVPWRLHPEVRTRVWKEQPAHERYPVIHKLYETPAGQMEQVVRQTEDWPHGDDVEVISDFNIPRSLRFLVESEADLERLPFILGAPSEDQTRGLREEASRLKKEAQRLGVALVGLCGAGADMAAWLCGLENFLIACRERPAFAREVLRVVHQWEIQRLQLLLDTGVCDIIFRRAWYEAPAFFSPAAFREFLFDNLRHDIELVHQAGCKYEYAQTVRPQDRLADLVELGVDVLCGVDPIQGGADLARLKREAGGRVCFCGGINSYVTLGRGTRREVHEAVRQAIALLARGGGFVLFPVDAVDRSVPWSHVEWAIEAWREWGGYPLRAPMAA